MKILGGKEGQKHDKCKRLCLHLLPPFPDVPTRKSLDLTEKLDWSMFLSLYLLIGLLCLRHVVMPKMCDSLYSIVYLQTLVMYDGKENNTEKSPRREMI